MKRWFTKRPWLTHHPLADPCHSFWRFLRVAVILAFLLAFLQLNATNFDDTELRTLGETLVLAAAVEIAISMATRFRNAYTSLLITTRLVLILSGLLLFLWINASNFDETELKTLTGVLGVAVAFEGFLKRFTGGSESEELQKRHPPRRRALE